MNQVPPLFVCELTRVDMMGNEDEQEIERKKRQSEYEGMMADVLMTITWCASFMINDMM